MGWKVSKKFDSEIISHGGNSTGYNAFIAFDKKKRQGVVVLSNSYLGNDEIALHILNSRYALAKPEAMKEHKAIKFDGKKFEPYAGEYQIAAPNATHAIVVSREEGRFFIQVATFQKEELLAESETEFFIERLALTVTFIKDGKEQVTNLVLNNDSKLSAKKIK